MLSSMSFQLEWSPPLEEHRNGVIMGYKISVEWGVDQVYTIDTPSTNYTITGLERGTTYHYSLAAYTIIGTGPYSNSTAVSLSGKNTTQTTSDFGLFTLHRFQMYPLESTVYSEAGEPNHIVLVFLVSGACFPGAAFGGVFLVFLCKPEHRSFENSAMYMVVFTI